MFNLKSVTKVDLERVISEYNLYLNWNYTDHGLDFIFENDNILALIEYSKHPQFNDYVMINNFEVLHKSKGIGSRIIGELTKNNMKLCLYPDNIYAEKFWMQMGFIGYDEGCGVKIYCYPELFI